MMNRVADRQREAEHVRVPIVGAQYAPALVELAESAAAGVDDRAEARRMPKQAVRDQR